MDQAPNYGLYGGYKKGSSYGKLGGLYGGLYGTSLTCGPTMHTCSNACGFEFPIYPMDYYGSSYGFSSGSLYGSAPSAPAAY